MGCVMNNSFAVETDSLLTKDDSLFSEKIDYIKSLILESVNIDIIKKVYLFGSYAYGFPNEESDIDLCVIIDNNYQRRKVAFDIKLNLYNNKITPTDLIVYNENDFENYSSTVGFEKTIKEEGVLLYG